MKRALLLMIALISFITSAVAQEWQTNVETAKNLASEQNKNIVLVFSGSDWCAPCIKLDTEIWNTEAFKKYAAENYIMLKADFPRRKKNLLPESIQTHNNQLAEQYNKNGYFPLVIVMDANGKPLGETGYFKTSPEEYIKLLNSFKG